MTWNGLARLGVSAVLCVTLAIALLAPGCGADPDRGRSGEGSAVWGDTTYKNPTNPGGVPNAWD